MDASHRMRLGGSWYKKWIEPTSHHGNVSGIVLKAAMWVANFIERLNPA